MNCGPWGEVTYDVDPSEVYLRDWQRKWSRLRHDCSIVLLAPLGTCLDCGLHPQHKIHEQIQKGLV